MEKLQIEKGIPFANRISEAAHYKYPFEDMEIGDSFLIPLEDNKRSTRQNARTLCRVTFERWAVKWSRDEYQIRTAQVEGGIRVWRVN